MARSTAVDDDITDYAIAHSTAPDEIQLELIAATAVATGDRARMQIGHDQAVFLAILTAALQPAFAVEIGTFTGYSALAVARALPPGGRLLCCDVSEEWTAIAREHWERAGVADRIDLRIAPAAETLASIDQPVDLAFIDADKGGYLDYYEALLPRLSPTGVILVDNTLWGGAVLDPADGDTDTAALRAFNDHVVADPRSEVALLTIGDGVTMIRHR